MFLLEYIIMSAIRVSQGNAPLFLLPANHPARKRKHGNCLSALGLDCLATSVMV